MPSATAPLTSDRFGYILNTVIQGALSDLADVQMMLNGIDNAAETAEAANALYRGRPPHGSIADCGLLGAVEEVCKTMPASMSSNLYCTDGVQRDDLWRALQMVKTRISMMSSALSAIAEASGCDRMVAP
jgi:hypothetical protein